MLFISYNPGGPSYNYALVGGGKGVWVVLFDIAINRTLDMWLYELSLHKSPPGYDHPRPSLM